MIVHPAQRRVYRYGSGLWVGSNSGVVTGSWGYQQVMSLAPLLEESFEVFGAEQVPLRLLQGLPLTVLVAGHGQSIVGEYAEPLVLELEAEVQV